jgi:small subunit ribosomal protein S16
MVRIRLTRTGLKKQPTYRIVVADRESPRDGKNIEIIGQYNPRTQPHSVNVDEARLLYWLSVGAQPSESVDKLIKPRGTYERLARLRKGEAMETLVAEAATAHAQHNPKTAKTRFAAPAAGQGTMKPKSDE